jgi:flagellar motor switch protein FliG
VTVGKEYSGPEKAAIVMISLGADDAAKIMENLDEKEIQLIADYMSSLGAVDMHAMNRTTQEFHQEIKVNEGGLGGDGKQFLKRTMLRAFGLKKTDRILENIEFPQEELGGGLETIRKLDPKTIAAYLLDEHPQTAAIILAHLDLNLAAKTISELPESVRMDIVRRLSELGRVSPAALRDLDNALQQKLSISAGFKGSDLGGFKVAADIMSGLNREMEAGILDSIDEIDPDTANEIRHFRFTYEDILKIDDQHIQLILAEKNQDDLILSLKTSSQAMKDKWFRNMSERAVLMAEEDLESLGPTKISEVEKAQQRIIALCKKLEQEGKISIGGLEEEQMV